MSLVVDTSVLAAWIFEEQAFAQAGEVVDLVAENTSYVPQLFAVEIANAVLVAERKRRISADYAVELLSMISELPLIVDPETGMRARQEIYPLAREEGLTVYAATYLELALRRDATLATLDVQLAAAARRRGVAVIP